MEVPSLLPEEAAGMEKVVDPPMNFLLSKTEGLLDYTLPNGSRFSASIMFSDIIWSSLLQNER